VKSFKTTNNKGDNFKVENGGIYKIFEDDHLQLALYTIYIVLTEEGSEKKSFKHNENPSHPPSR
jgi:hypothetical protein